MSIAFFDLDGTLLPHPSLERRFFWSLFRQGKIPAVNYVRWAAEMRRLTTTKAANALQENKMYLRGLPANVLSQIESPQSHWMPEFFPGAIQRVWWHALRGDAIVLATGTLAPLAENVKAALELELLWRGVEAQIFVIATRLVTLDGRWTGTVDSVPMFGEAKASAIREFADGRGVALRQCFAYGDHELDRWMLESVGNPIAANPRARLRRIAHQNRWQIIKWTPCPRRAIGTRHALKWKGQFAR